LTIADPRAKVVYQHTAAHILGQAVKAIYPTAKLVDAPGSKNGFYYDVVFASDPDEGTLARIADEMRNIIAADLSIVREEMSRTVAIKIMRRYGEYYKIQTIEALPKGTRVSLYRFGDFVDLTKGAHLTHTGQIVDFVLTGMTRRGEQGKIWRIEGKALTEKAVENPVPRAGRAKTVGVRMPARKRNNM
jgi:threonyl-tRNA synthetase